MAPRRTTPRPPITGGHLAKFWSRVDRLDDDECWRWTRPLNSSGYGSFTYDGNKVGAHVASLIIDGRTPPPGMVAHHHCFNRWCVNPGHLDVRTMAENNAAKAPGYVHFKSKVTHCPSGHPYDGDNLAIERRSRDGGAVRVCRICRNARALARYHRLRAVA